MLKPITAMSLALALQLGGCANAEPPSASAGIPDSIKTGADEWLAFVTPAKGVQLYECRASKDKPGAYEWTFVAPEADLFDQRGHMIGRHFAGPHWQANDGSKVFAVIKARADAPSGDAIPWLLLATQSVGREGAFSKVTSIQRINTVGGMPPRDGCTQAAAGTWARVNYTADYRFFAAR